MVERKIEVYTLRYLENGIFHVHVNDGIQTLKGMKEAIDVMGEIVNYNKVPMLVTYDSFVTPESELRSYWAKSESCPYVIAEAMIFDSLGLKIMGNFYFKIDKPERPTKIFTNQEEAIKWLKTFL